MEFDEPLPPTKVSSEEGEDQGGGGGDGVERQQEDEKEQQGVERRQEAKVGLEDREPLQKHDGPEEQEIAHQPEREEEKELDEDIQGTKEKNVGANEQEKDEGGAIQKEQEPRLKLGISEKQEPQQKPENSEEAASKHVSECYEKEKMDQQDDPRELEQEHQRECPDEQDRPTEEGSQEQHEKEGQVRPKVQSDPQFQEEQKMEQGWNQAEHEESQEPEQHGQHISEKSATTQLSSDDKMVEADSRIQVQEVGKESSFHVRQELLSTPSQLKGSSLASSKEIGSLEVSKASSENESRVDGDERSCAVHKSTNKETKSRSHDKSGVDRLGTEGGGGDGSTVEATDANVSRGEDLESRYNNADQSSESSVVLNTMETIDFQKSTSVTDVTIRSDEEMSSYGPVDRISQGPELMDVDDIFSSEDVISYVIDSIINQVLNKEDNNANKDSYKDNDEDCYDNYDHDYNGENHDSEGNNSDSESRPTLKLASFADSINRQPVFKASSASTLLDTCQVCGQAIMPNDTQLLWDSNHFCHQTCLRDFQHKSDRCSSCGKGVEESAFGKYSVRFSGKQHQFCDSKCIEDYKKSLKICSYCNKDLKNDPDGFLAPVGDHKKFKLFCSQLCVERFLEIESGGLKKKKAENRLATCAVCKESKIINVQLSLKQEKEGIELCSETCLSAYIFANRLTTFTCDQCGIVVEGSSDLKVKYFEGESKKIRAQFCSLCCQSVYIGRQQRIVQCGQCRVHKLNLDMIAFRNQQSQEIGKNNLGRDKIDYLCSVQCLQSSRDQVAYGRAKTRKPDLVPVIQSVSSLAPKIHVESSSSTMLPSTMIVPSVMKEVIYRHEVATEQCNKSVLTKPVMKSKGVSCGFEGVDKECQTDFKQLPAVMPIPCPMYTPIPLHMYNKPYPVPVPVPLPVPVPVFVPITRNSYRGVMKHIRRLHSKMPSDPFEAELLAMAGALANEKQEDSPDSEADGNEDVYDDMDEESGRREGLRSPSVDVENVITGGKVLPKALPMPSVDLIPSPGPRHIQPNSITGGQQSANNANNGLSSNKRRRPNVGDGNMSEEENWTPVRGVGNRRSRPNRSRKVPKIDQRSSTPPVQSSTAAKQQQPKERPDAKHHLKFTYGVNAWRHWVVQKNVELEQLRSQGKYMKTFETDVLKLRADELNYTLCMFVNEVRKPNNERYAADSILYLTLGIQSYLFESGRIDNIFTDLYYEPFTTALHEVIKDFRLPINELGYYVTRIEEEHLWECRQLGAHSPQSLLNTLVYFNTKYFLLKTTEQHNKLSFPAIMKNWKKNNTNNTKSCILRYYPQPSSNNYQKSKSRVNQQHVSNDERRCYEQQEDTENPVRCPIKLYEFYLSKCPENTRSRSDLFYLQPERSCVPDSPVWFSSTRLNTHQLEKMLHRLLVVREVQEHIIADSN